VKIDKRHWLFCRDQYAETWYQVIYTDDMQGVHRFLILYCGLETVKDLRSDPAVQELPPEHEVASMEIIDVV
jgi:hypothetical protein